VKFRNNPGPRADRLRLLLFSAVCAVALFPPALSARSRDSTRQTVGVLNLSPKETPQPIADSLAAELQKSMADQASFLSFLNPEDIVSALDLPVVAPEVKSRFESGSLYLADGVQAYDRLNFAEALDLLNQAEVKLLGCRQDLEIEPALWKLYLYRGMARRALDQEAEAKADFTRALVLDPQKALDPTLFAPDVVAYYQQVQEELIQAPASTLTVIPSHKDAQVFLDGRLLGTGTLTEIKLLPGTHWVSAQKPGYRPFRQELAVGESQNLSLEAPLASQPNLLLVDSFRQKLQARASLRDLSRLADEIGGQVLADYLLAVLVEPQPGRENYVISAYLFNLQERGQLSGRESAAVLPYSREASRTIKVMAENLIPTYEAEVSEELLELKRQKRNQAIWWGVGGTLLLGGAAYAHLEAVQATEDYNDVTDDYNTYLHSGGILKKSELENMEDERDKYEKERNEFRLYRDIGLGAAAAFYGVSIYYAVSSAAIRPEKPGRIKLSERTYLDLAISPAEAGWSLGITREMP